MSVDYVSLGSKRTASEGIGVTVFSDGSQVYEISPQKPMSFLMATFQPYTPASMFLQVQTTHEDMTVESSIPHDALTTLYAPGGTGTQSLMTGSVDSDITQVISDHFDSSYLSKLRSILRPSPMTSHPLSDAKVYKKKGILVKHAEIPYHRYNRLKMELRLFKKDLSTLAKEMPTEAENCEKLIRGLVMMLGRLDELKAEYSHTSTESKTDDLICDLFSQDLDFNRRTFMNAALQSILDDAINHRMTEDRKSRAKPGDVDTDESVSQMWTISLKDAPAKASGTWDFQFVDCEDRLAVLEKLVGIATDMRNPFPDLVHATFYIESKMYRLDNPDLFKRTKTTCHQFSSSLRSIGFAFDNLKMRISKIGQHQHKLAAQRRRQQLAKPKMIEDGKTDETRQTTPEPSAEEGIDLDYTRSETPDPSRSAKPRVMTEKDKDELVESFVGLERMELLYDTMHRCDPSITDLARVCSRMITLDNYYRRLINLHKKTDDLHSQLSTLSQSLLDDRNTLKEAQQSMIANTRQMTMNLESLKARLTYLESKD